MYHDTAKYFSLKNNVACENTMRFRNSLFIEYINSSEGKYCVIEDSNAFEYVVLTL